MKTDTLIVLGALGIGLYLFIRMLGAANLPNLPETLSQAQGVIQ